MSLISKLFRKHEPDEASHTALAPALEEAAVAPVVAEQAGVPTLDQTGDAEAGTEHADVPTLDQTGDAAAGAEPGDGDATDEQAPWWESSAPGDASAPTEHAPEPAAIALDAQPAADLAPETAPAEEDGGTRPLSGADLPTLAAQRSRRGLAVAALRDIGRVRQINQDSVYALITTLPREGSDITLGLFVVADGMGGHHGGEVASRLAIATVARHVLAELVLPALEDGSTEALQPLIVAAVQEANRAIWEQAQLIGSDMGTTCTVALLLGRALYVGHVGDSRAYLATPGGLRQITDDHSTVGRLIKLGQLDPSEAREHPLRSQLYRTIGQQPDVQVDFVYQQLGDATHLLMCSDGLWGMLDDELMLDVLEHSSWPQDACHELIARANLVGGDDNITAVVVSLPAQA